MPRTSWVSTPSGNDSLRQVAGVVLQSLHATGFQHLDVVVVHRGRLGEDLLGGHGGQQLGIGDPAGPLLTQLGPVLPEVGHQLPQQGVHTSRLVGRVAAVWACLVFGIHSSSGGLKISRRTGHDARFRCLYGARFPETKSC